MRAILLTVFASFAVSGCSRPHTIVGAWRHSFDTGAETFEFLKNGSFYIKSASPAFKGEIVIFKGSYTVVDSNHIHIDFAPGALTNKPPLTTPGTLLYSLSGDELELQRLTMAGDLEKYRRVR
jgi:hypothetical protein